MQQNSLPKKLNSVLISTYTHIQNGVRTNGSGPVNPLLNFFAQFTDVTVYIIEQPLPHSDFKEILFRKIQGGKELLHIQKPILFSFPNQKLHSNKTYLRLKLRDLISNFAFLYPHIQKKIDLFIGLESVNASCGSILKKMNFVNEVVYYIFDWAPDRYENQIMNKIYLGLDKFASYTCDSTWNITYTIGEARLNILGYNPKKLSPQLYVPYSYNYSAANIAEDEDINPNLIVYSGGLIQENGPHILIDAFDIVLESFPKAKLLIIGGGDGEERIEKQIKDSRLEKNVQVTGYISDEEEIIKLQNKAAIAVAPYPIMKRSRKPYGDVIKIRIYFACGLPVISTPVPPVIKEIRDEGLGEVTLDDSQESIAKEIIKYLSNPSKIFEDRKRVIDKAKKSNWNDNYSNALQKMGYLV